MKFGLDQVDNRVKLTRGGTPVSVLHAYAGGTEPLDLAFFLGSSTKKLPGADWSISWGFKDSEGTLLALADDWTYNSGTSSYQAMFSLNTTEILTALGDEDSITVYAQLAWSLDPDDTPFVSQVIEVTLHKNVIGLDEGTPTGVPNPTVWLQEQYANAAEKTTPVDADSFLIRDSEAAGVLKKFTWANLKAALRAFFVPKAVVLDAPPEEETAMIITGTLTDGSDPVVFPPLIEQGVFDGKPFYESNTEGFPICSASWQSTFWQLIYQTGSGDTIWFSNEDVATPDLVSVWTPVGPATGAPTVTAVEATESVPGQLVEDINDLTSIYFKGQTEFHRVPIITSEGLLPDFGQAPKTTAIPVAGLVTGGGTLAAMTPLTVTEASQAEAEAMAASNVVLTPRRGLQLLSAWWTANGASKANSAVTITGSGLVTGGGNLTANRTLTVTESSQAEAEAMTASNVVLTPRRGLQMLAAWLANLTTVVKTSGDQTIAGVKTFSSPPRSSGSLTGVTTELPSVAQVNALSGQVGSAVLLTRTSPAGSGANLSTNFDFSPSDLKFPGANDTKCAYLLDILTTEPAAFFARYLIKTYAQNGLTEFADGQSTVTQVNLVEASDYYDITAVGVPSNGPFRVTILNKVQDGGNWPICFRFIPVFQPN